MIIVEGPDGAGKSTLIKTLVPWLNEVLLDEWSLAERVVGKDTKTSVNLRAWTDENLAKGFHTTVYDRHRLISDPIYSVAMGKNMEFGGLYEFPWLLEAWNQLVECEPLIIYCLPPYSLVQRNVISDPDNLVTSPFIGSIYHGYVAQISMLSSLYDGVLIYDYSERDSLEALLENLRQELL